MVRHRILIPGIMGSNPIILVLEGNMDSTTKNLMIDLGKNAEKIAKLLKKGDVELRKDGNKIKVIAISKKQV